MQKFITASPEETEALAERLAAVLKGDEIIAFKGGLGAGKTAFTRGLARAFGITDGVSSPTFALVHEYRGRCTIYHFDMYRVSGWDDLYSTGFFDYEGSGIMVIEWSENIEDFLPENHITIRIACLGENEREIMVEGVEIDENSGS